jgi:Flp pilus assembly protein TadD
MTGHFIPKGVVVSACALYLPLAFGLPRDKVQEARHHVEVGLQLAQAGDLAKAETELRKALELSPNDPLFLAHLGGVLSMQQRLQDANVYFEKALKLDPDNLVIRRNLAANQWQLGDLQLAKQNLERILKAKPRDPSTILLLGMVAENLKDYRSAAELLSSVQDLVRQRSESIAALARSYYDTPSPHDRPICSLPWWSGGF